MKKYLATSCLALALMAGSASAANILTVVTDSSDSLISGDFNPAVTGSSSTPSSAPEANVNDPVKVATTAGYGLKLDDVADITFTYLGKEADFTNVLLYGVDEIFSSQVNPAGRPQVVRRAVSPTVPGGFLPFAFTSSGNGETFVVKNGFGATDSAGRVITTASIAFKMITESLDDATYVVLLNDPGSGDADYDDFVFLVTAHRLPKDASTPIPAGVVLLMSGLAGLGYMGRARTGKKP